MKFGKKSIYALITVIFIVITVIELFEYFICDSSLFGLIYLLINFIIVFFLSMITVNYNKADKMYRISKVFIVVLLGFFASYILKFVIYNYLDYKIYSSTLETYIFLTKNILKPILYSCLLVIGLIEFDKELKFKHKKGFLNFNLCKKIVSKFRK